MCFKRSLLSQLIGTWNRAAYGNNSIAYVVVKSRLALKMYLTHQMLTCFAVQGTVVNSLSKHCLMIFNLQRVSILEIK